MKLLSLSPKLSFIINIFFAVLRLIQSNRFYSWVTFILIAAFTFA